MPHLMKLLALHLMAVFLTAGCLYCADLGDEQALFLLPAGASIVAVFGTLKALFLEIRCHIS